MATIGVSLILSSGVETLTLELYNAGALLNTGGDALVEVGTSGYFEADVAEAIVADLDAVIKQDGVPIAGGTLYLGQSQVGRVAGSDATLAKQDEILAAVQGAQVVQVESPNVRGNLVLTQGDTYDGIGNPKAQWNTTVDYTDGWAVALTIRDKGDAVVYTTTGTVDSATVVSVAITTPTGLPMSDFPPVWKGKFDVQLTKGSSIKTIALGAAYINEDVTR